MASDYRPSEAIGPALRRSAPLAVFVALAACAWLSHRNGAFYDDEIWTLLFMARVRDAAGIVTLANALDVHPPLGYVLDHALYGLTGDWKQVQLAKGLYSAALLALAVRLAARGMERGPWLILCALVATCATSVMWHASLRWYGWFNPLWFAALAVILWGRIGPVAAMAVLVASSVVLFHIGYLAVIAGPLLALPWLWRYRAAMDRRTAAWSLGIVVAGLLACLPQALVLVRVHLADPDAQSGLVILALAQTGATVLLGNAVFPIGLLPLAAALVIAATLLAFVRRTDWRAPLAALWAVLIAGSLAMGLSGLGARPRNSVFLYLAALPLLAAALAALPGRWRIAALGVVALFQVQGAANVSLRQHTAKRSFNTPHRAVLHTVAAQAAGCGRTVLAHDDIVLGHLADRHLAQAGPMGERGAMALAKGDCLFVSHGSADDRFEPQWTRWRGGLDSLPLRRAGEWTFAHEPASAAAGRLLGRELPAYSAVLTLYRAEGSLVLPALME